MTPIISKLAKLLSTLPTLGPRSAKKIALNLFYNQKTLTKDLKNLLEKLDQVKECVKCNNLCISSECEICLDYARDHNQICIVEDISSLWAIEKIGQYEGIFYILNDDANTNEAIEKKILTFINNSEESKEFILALSSTIEGQALAGYIESILKQEDNVKISALNLGLPMGSQMSYIDQGTLTIAFTNRKEVK